MTNTINTLELENTAAVMNNSFDRRARKYGQAVAMAWVTQDGLFPATPQPAYEYCPFSGMYERV